MDSLVTVEEFIKQVWKIEGVKINLNPKDGATGRLVRSYNYERLSGNATVNDLYERIDKCVNEPFVYTMEV